MSSSGKRLTSENIPTLYTGEEATVLLVLQALLDSVQHHDPEKVKDIYYPAAGTARLRADGLIILTMEEIMKHLMELPSNIDEYMYDPEVRIAGNLAMIWTPCNITIDGKLAVKATNLVSLHKENGKWKISGVSDTASDSIDKVATGKE